MQTMGFRIVAQDRASGKWETVVNHFFQHKATNQGFGQAKRRANELAQRWLRNHQKTHQQALCIIDE